MYVDAKFLGSASIKNVLPVISPELSYKELAIQDGQVASATWARTAAGEISAPKPSKLLPTSKLTVGRMRWRW